jgi:hypothetical protein
MLQNREVSLNELRALLDKHARPDLATAIDGVRICKVDYAAAPESSMSGTVLAVIAQGSKRLALGDRFYDYGAGQYLVASVDVPVTGQVIDVAPGMPTLGFGMTLEPSVIAELLLQDRPGDLPRSWGTAGPGIAVSGARMSCSTPSCGCRACSTGRGTESIGPAVQAGDTLAADDRGPR